MSWMIYAAVVISLDATARVMGPGGSLPAGFATAVVGAAAFLCGWLSRDGQRRHKPGHCEHDWQPEKFCQTTTHADGWESRVYANSVCGICGKREWRWPTEPDAETGV